jgi:hypothetical protein
MTRKSPKLTVVGMDHTRSISEGRHEWRCLRPIAARKIKPAHAAERDSKLSHPNQVCLTACASFAAAIAQGIKTGNRDAMLRTAKLFMGSPQNSLIREVLAAALAGSKPSGVDGPEQGWVAIA